MSPSHSPRKSWHLFGLPALLLSASLFLAGCGGSKVDKSHYDQVTSGMTPAQVEAILGPGKEQAGGGIGGLSVKTVVWQEGNKTITVMFMNDKVSGKTEQNL